MDTVAERQEKPDCGCFRVIAWAIPWQLNHIVRESVPTATSFSDNALPISHNIDRFPFVIDRKQFSMTVVNAESSLIIDAVI